MSFIRWRIVLGDYHLLHGRGVDDQAAVFTANHSDFHTWIILIPSYGLVDICKPVVAGAYHNIASHVCSRQKPHENIVVMVYYVHSGETREMGGLAVCHPGNGLSD